MVRLAGPAMADPCHVSVACLPENVALYEHLTARENIEHCRKVADCLRPKAEIEAAFEGVGLGASAGAMRAKAGSRRFRRWVLRGSADSRRCSEGAALSLRSGRQTIIRPLLATTPIC
jgi:hypothetical protein